MSNSKTPTEITTDNTSPIPNRSNLGSASGFEKALKSMGIEVPPRQENRPFQNEGAPILMALELCGLTPGTEQYRANYRAFMSVMLELGMERSLEIVRTFASELRQGEMEGIRSLPALLMTRLQQNRG